MTALLTALVVACTAGDISGLEPQARRDAACDYLARAPLDAHGLNPGRLSAIYADPEFAHARERNSGALEALMRRLYRFLADLFETKEASGFAEWTRVVVLAVALCVGALGLVRWRLAVAKKKTKASPRLTAAAALELDDPALHLERARLSLATRPRHAIREALFALLSSLERRRLARPDRVKTNRELHAELPSRGAPPDLVQSVGELLRWYDDTFYSLTEVPTAEAARFIDAVSREVEPAGAQP